jgi:hypothetical protein
MTPESKYLGLETPQYILMLIIKDLGVATPESKYLGLRTPQYF